MIVDANVKFQIFKVIRAPKLRTHSNACLVNLAVMIISTNISLDIVTIIRAIIEALSENIIN